VKSESEWLAWWTRVKPFLAWALGVVLGVAVTYTACVVK
jgi:hypothetical protein